MRLIFLLLILVNSTAFADTELIEPEVEQAGDAIEQRLKEESINELSKFTMIPHKQNYILPLNYNEKIKHYGLYQDDAGNNTADQKEIKYQISFKMPLFHHLDHLPISGYIAYTQTSFWQAYNSEYSAPFRETNYEPEAFLVWKLDKEFAGKWKLNAMTFGFTHQSNGRSEPISRSWNRLNGNILLSNQNFVIAINPWIRLSKVDSVDNNPDLLDYYGHGQVTFAYKHNNHVYSLTSRNNIESGFSKGSIEASWSFPLYKNIKGYVQVFSGYGNSMIEYDVYTNTIGIGFIVADLL